MNIGDRNIIINKEKQGRSKINHTEHFLVNGKSINWDEKILSDEVKENWNIVLIYKDQIKEWQKISSIIYAMEEILWLKIKKIWTIDYYVENHHNLKNPDHILPYIKPHIKRKNEKNYQNKINNIKNFGKKLWININDQIIKSSIYILNKDKNWHTKIRWYSESKDRSMYFLLWSEDGYIFYHEYGHHIWEQQKIKNFEWYDYDIAWWYTSRLWSAFVDEAFTELFAYWCQKLEKWKNSNLDPNINYNFHVKSITQLMRIAAKKINKSNEYIYNYMMRWYLIKWNKWLSIFYNAFGRDFLKWLMELWSKQENKILFIRLVEKYHFILWFSNARSAAKHFDISTNPSQEIGDIAGINR